MMGGKKKKEEYPTGNKHHRLEKGSVTEVVLRILAGGGLLTMMVIAPNAIQALPVFIPALRRKQYVKTTLTRIVERGLADWRRSPGGKKYLTLTTKGKLELNRFRLKKLQIPIPRRWDMKWRLIIFDIKELRRSNRDQFRQQLIEFGFSRLQNSVWVFPYECGELIQLLKTSYRLGKDVLYLTVEKIENDFELKEKFGLLN